MDDDDGGGSCILLCTATYKSVPKKTSVFWGTAGTAGRTISRNRRKANQKVGYELRTLTTFQRSLPTWIYGLVGSLPVIEVRKSNEGVTWPLKTYPTYNWVRGGGKLSQIHSMMCVELIKKNISWQQLKFERLFLSAIFRPIVPVLKTPINKLHTDIKKILRNTSIYQP
jgi:hypothetical protein